MNVQNPFCNPQTVGQFLADQLSDLEQAAFEAHLNGCAECQERLESTAAEGSWWSDARAYLASSDSSPGATGTSDWPPSDNNADERQAATLFGLKNYLAPTDDPRMLGRVGAYEIPGIIGSGGMGVVLKGFDPALNRYVAIKVMTPSLAASGAARRRFAREAQAAAAVVHDNVMAIHAVAEAQGLPYLVMPYVRGASLDQRLRAKGPLAIEEVLRIALQVAAGLAAAHAQGLIHRDIKPANILLEDGVERVKITDFGLARAADDASLTGSGAIAGTPQYMSPEQASGEAMDHRSDLFSLGSVIYAMCTGRPPFRAETSYGVLRRICESEPRAIVEVNSAIPSSGNLMDEIESGGWRKSQARQVERESTARTDVPSATALDPTPPERLLALELASENEEAKARFAKAQSAYAFAKKQHRQGYRTSLELDSSASMLRHAELQLKQSQVRLDAFARRDADQTTSDRASSTATDHPDLEEKFLQLDLEEAKLNLSTAETTYDLHHDGNTPKDEMTALTAKVGLAKIQVERAETKLDLHKRQHPTPQAAGPTGTDARE